jgi:hypothetical protein
VQIKIIEEALESFRERHRARNPFLFAPAAGFGAAARHLTCGAKGGEVVSLWPRVRDLVTHISHTETQFCGATMFMLEAGLLHK